MFNREKIILASIIVSLVVSLIIFYQNVIKYKPVLIKYSPSQNDMFEIQKLDIEKVVLDEKILNKNLFNPERTFSFKKEEENKIQQPIESIKQKPNIQLKGIVQNLDGEYEVIITMDNKDTVKLRVGEKYKDIEVVEISDRTAELNWYGEPIILTLNKVMEMKERGK